MDSYEIIMTPDAAEDLYGLRNYIADALLVPDIALYEAFISIDKN